MGALRLVIVLVVAAAAAVALALGFRQLTASHASTAVAATPKVQPQVQIRVLVAKRDLPIGWRLTPEDVTWQPWPKNAVNPQFITGGPVKDGLVDKAQTALAGDPTIQSVAGSLVRVAMIANEPMSQRKLVRGGQAGFMAVKLPTGMRAMATPVNVDTGVAGFILPGDHVDVVQNIKLSPSASGAPNIQTRIVLQNITVLAIDQAPDAKPGAAALVGATATLMVPEADVDILAKAREEGSLQLALRSYDDMAGPQGAVHPAPIRGSYRFETAAVRIFRGVKASEVRVP
ncbi:MAG: Flp pilus assembly protein CpaB [Caulobacteraceae bacterium]